MGTPSVANILKSGAICWIAPAGEALPDETSIDAGEAWGGNWARVGFTKEPVKLMIEDEFFEGEVEEYIMAVMRKRVGRKASVETVLAELTADYLALTIGGTVTTTAAGVGQKGYEDLQAGDDVELDQYVIGFEGVRYDASANALPIRFGFRICTFKLNGELKFSRRDDEYSGIPFAANALTPTDTTTAIWFQRVTAPATPV